MVEADALGALPLQFDAERFSPENRRRLSAPAFRTYLAVANLWCLSPERHRQMLGSPSLATYRRWVREARANGAFTLSEAVLTRISAIFGIHQALAILFATEREAIEWLRTPHQAVPFSGRRPLDLMVGSKLKGLKAVRRFLDGACQGLYMPPNSIDADFHPYADDEIVIQDSSIGDAQGVEAAHINPARVAAERAAKARAGSFRREIAGKVADMDFPREIYVVTEHLRARKGARTVAARMRHESGDDVSLVELKVRDNAEHMRFLNFLTDRHDEIVASFDWDRVRVRELFESAGFSFI